MIEDPGWREEDGGWTSRDTPQWQNWAGSVVTAMVCTRRGPAGFLADPGSEVFL